MAVLSRDSYSGVPNTVKLSTDDWCALNLDGSLKYLSNTEPEFSPHKMFHYISYFSSINFTS